MTDVTELTYGRTKTFLINGKLLIDTDWAGTLSAFLNCIKELGISLDGIEYLLVTHYHPDHMGIAADLMARGVKLLVMDVQKNFIHRPDGIFAEEKKTRFTPIPDEQVIYLKCEDSRDFLKKLGIEGKIIATPGHSDDSISLILDEGKAAFIGDIPPLEQIEYYHDTVLKKSVETILGRGVKTLYHSHWPDEEIMESKKGGTQNTESSFTFLCAIISIKNPSYQWLFSTLMAYLRVLFMFCICLSSDFSRR